MGKAARASGHTNAERECVAWDRASRQRDDHGARMSCLSELARLNGDAWTLLARFRANARFQVHDIHVPLLRRTFNHGLVDPRKSAVALEVAQGATAFAADEPDSALPSPYSLRSLGRSFEHVEPGANDVHLGPNADPLLQRFDAPGIVFLQHKGNAHDASRI